MNRAGGRWQEVKECQSEENEWIKERRKEEFMDEGREGGVRGRRKRK